MVFRIKKVGPEYYFRRGNECLERGDHHWALESFSKVIEYNPDFEMAYRKRAEVYKAMGRTREAVWDLIRFLEVDRRIPGMAEDLDDVVKEAFNIARMGMQRDGARQEILAFGIPNLLEELMEGYDPQGKYTETKFYDLALSSLDAGSPKNMYYIGFLLLLKKDFDKAMEEFDKAIEENPENPDAYYFRGVVLVKKMKLFEKKAFRSKQMEKIKKLSEAAHSDFEQALRMGFMWGICPDCGYRTSSAVNFCMRCGKPLSRGGEAELRAPSDA